MVDLRIMREELEMVPAAVFGPPNNLWELKQKSLYDTRENPIVGVAGPHYPDDGLCGFS